MLNFCPTIKHDIGFTYLARSAEVAPALYFSEENHTVYEDEAFFEQALLNSAEGLIVVDYNNSPVAYLRGSQQFGNIWRISIYLGVSIRGSGFAKNSIPISIRFYLCWHLSIFIKNT